jgi:hypothetical protein
MQAKVERIEVELARLNSALIAPTSTNANNVTEDAISPSALLVTGVDPDTETSETGPPKDSNVMGRASSPKASLSMGSNQILLAQRLFPPTILTLQRDQSLQQHHYHNKSIQPLCKQRLVPKAELIT